MQLIVVNVAFLFQIVNYKNIFHLLFTRRNHGNNEKVLSKELQYVDHHIIYLDKMCTNGHFISHTNVH